MVRLAFEFFVLYLASTCSSLISLPLWAASTRLHSTLRMASSSMSGSPHNANMFTDTRDKLHVNGSFLCLIYTCKILVLLYVFYMMHLSLICFNCFYVVLGNKFLNMLNGIRLPSLSASTLYAILHLCFCLLATSS